MTIAGITDMLFQVFLFSGIDGGGLSNTVPLQIGIGTLFGTFFTWLVDRRANLVFFIPGVILNLLAVVFDALTYHFLNKDNAKKNEQNLLETGEPEKPRLSTTQTVLICATGALMGIPFGPGTAMAGREPYALSPYVFSPILSYS